MVAPAIIATVTLVGTGLAKFGALIAAKAGAAAVAHAAATAATHAGVSAATAATVGQAAGGAVIAGEVIGIGAGVSLYAKTRGDVHLAAAREIAVEAKKQRDSTKQKVETDYHAALMKQESLIAEIRAKSSPVLSKFGDQAAEMDTSDLPSIKRLLWDISNLPRVPQRVSISTVKVPEFTEALASLTPVEMQAINHAVKTGHPVVGLSIYVAKIAGSLVVNGVDYCMAAAEQKELATDQKRKIEAACETLLRSHIAACEDFDVYCAHARKLFDVTAAPGLLLAGTNRSWSALTNSEQQDVAALKIVHDTLVASLNALIEPSNDIGEKS